MTESEKIDLSISREVLKNTAREVSSLLCPPLATFYNITNELGSYRSKVKIERQNYCIENLLLLFISITYVFQRATMLYNTRTAQLFQENISNRENRVHHDLLNYNVD